MRSVKKRSEVTGMTASPSATSAAMAHIFGPSPPTTTDGGGQGPGGGENTGVMSVWVRNGPRWSSGSPSCHVAKIARTASTVSRIRATGRSKSAPNRRSTWVRIWVPSPRVNRPPDNACRSHALCAMCTAFRGNAIATLVITARSVAAAASASGRNTSWGPSKVNTPSTPARSSRAASVAASASP